MKVNNSDVRVGLLLSGWVDPSVSMVIRSRDLLDRVQLGREYGFSSVWVGQHILAEPWPMLDTTAFLGRISAVAEGMEIGGVYLLPLANPVRLAESLLSLDVLSNGGFILAAAMGWRRHEFDVLGVPIDERVGRFNESLALIRQLWTEREPFDFEGKYFNVQDALLAAQPVREGGIPVWIGASSVGAVRRAARRADAWLASSHTPMPVLRDLVHAFDEETTELGIAPVRRPIFRHCLIGESEATALKSLKAGLEGYYGAFREWGLFSDVVGEEYSAEQVAELSRDRVIFGDPEMCVESFREYRALGFNEFILQVGLPGVDELDVRRSIELLGTEVLPALRKDEA